MICSSPLNINAYKIVNKLVRECWIIKKWYCKCINTVFHDTTLGDRVDDKLIKQLVGQCSEFINDSDLHLCLLILNLLCENNVCITKFI